MKQSQFDSVISVSKCDHNTCLGAMKGTHTLSTLYPPVTIFEKSSIPLLRCFFSSCKRKTSEISMITSIFTSADTSERNLLLHIDGSPKETFCAKLQLNLDLLLNAMES